MAEPDRRPSAQEIDELLELVRRDPGSPAFIDLGEAYLALGRAREAIDVGLAGLAVAPDRTEGRVMIARRGVEELVAREAQGVDGVLEARAQVKQKRTGFHVIGQVSVSPTTNLPELTKEVQQRVKAAVTRHLGAQVSEVCIQTQLSPLSTRRQAVRRVR